ncbi:hypothetical protein DB30_04223 [Enhygromyxa salina]|uniref:Uncharacterized protein n=2 Tax=Enhygromyxa salina TaxID=215803 RepID=A0A0C1ZG49_9BACT|nr:hypothetical protein DB30_04223 [Enhygromyxa salina]
MGDAWGIPMPNTDFRAERVIDYYEGFRWRPRLPFTMLGMDVSGLGAEYFLDERTNPPVVASFYKGGPPTLVNENPEDYEIEAPSLPDFVFMMFFFLRQIKGSPIVIDASKATNLEGMLEKSVDLLRKLGLPEHPRSTGDHLYFHAPTVSVVVHRPEGHGLGVEIGGRDEGRVEQIFALLDDHLSLVRVST